MNLLLACLFIAALAGLYWQAELIGELRAELAERTAQYYECGEELESYRE